MPCWMAQRTNTAAGFLPSFSATLFTVLSCCSPMAPIQALSASMTGKSVISSGLFLQYRLASLTQHQTSGREKMIMITAPSF